MQLIVLGSGTSGSNIKGIPNRYPPAFLVQWNNETLLFDCSEGVRFRLEKMGICYADLRHIAMSHAHPDHNALVNYIHSVAFRNYVLGHKGLDLNIYAPEQIVRDFPMVWKGYVPDDFAREEDIWPVLKFHALPNQSMPSMQIGSGKLEAFEVFHGSGKCDALAYRLDTPEGVFAYSGDTGDCAGIRAACSGADIFVCEASAKIGSFESALAYGHLTPYQAGDIAKAGNVSKLILFHYTGLEKEEQILADCRASGYDGDLVCCQDFDVFEVNKHNVLSELSVHKNA